MRNRHDLPTADAEDTSVEREQGAGEGIYTAGGDSGPGKEACGTEGSAGPDEPARVSGEDTQVH